MWQPEPVWNGTASTRPGQLCGRMQKWRQRMFWRVFLENCIFRIHKLMRMQILNDYGCVREPNLSIKFANKSIAWRLSNVSWLLSLSSQLLWKSSVFSAYACVWLFDHFPFGLFSVFYFCFVFNDISFSLHVPAYIRTLSALDIHLLLLLLLMNISHIINGWLLVCSFLIEFF